MQSRPMVLMLASVMLLTSACGSGGDGGVIQPPSPPPAPPAPPPPPPPPPASPPLVSVVDGNGQTAPRGTRLPVQVRVLVTRDGAPLSNQVVTWRTTALHGFFDGAATETRTDGTAVVFWTLGTPLGPQGGTATLDGGASVAFGATATAGQSGPVVDVILTSAGGFRFEPANLVIAPGTTVRWTWLDDIHDIVSTGTPAFSGTGAFNPPKIHEVTFTAPGTYRYVCTFHAIMRGTVVVE